MTENFERRDLEILATFIQIHVESALRAAIVRGAAQHLFYEFPTRFSTNPENTFICEAVAALEKLSIVQISDILENETKLFAIPTDIRQKKDLLKHRHVISHPALVDWDKPWMKEFYNDKRYYTDVRAALVWDMQRSINDRLRELGGKICIEQITITQGMVIAMSAICSLSMMLESHCTIPSEQNLLQLLHSFGKRFFDLLEKYPDGRVIVE